MVFTSAAEAKPKVPHKHGRACRSCGVTEASQWRGPGGDFCSCCTKEAKAAREALKADEKDKLLAELTGRLEDAEDRLGAQAEELRSQAAAIFQLNQTVAAMQEELARRPGEPMPTAAREKGRTAGAKRSALTDRTNNQAAAAAPPPAKRAAAAKSSAPSSLGAPVSTGVVPHAGTLLRWTPLDLPPPMISEKSC